VGIALGLGVIVGVRAATAGSFSLAVFCAGILIVLALTTRRDARLIIVLAAAGCCAGAIAAVLQAEPDSAPSAPNASGPISGTIAGDPETTTTGVVVDLRWRDSMGVERTSRAFFPAAPVVGRGDRVRVIADVEGFGDGTLFVRGVQHVQPAGTPEAWRRSIRSYLAGVIDQRVPGTPGALALGLLVGDDSDLPEIERVQLREAGLSHITAVSGWNVALVTGAIGGLLLALRLRGWAWASVQLAGLVLFVWIVGADPPVIRAALMGTAGIVAARLGRPAHSVTLLVLAAAVMAALSPASLTSLSFRLSVLATIGLVVAVHLTRSLTGVAAVVVVPAVASAAIGLATAPLLAAELGTFTPAAIPANVAAGALVSAATCSGAVLVLLSPLPVLSELAGWCVWLSCGGVLAVARLFANAPLGHWTFAPVSGEAQAVMYTALIVACALALPEGRLVGRRLARWSREQPAHALASLVGAAIVLIAPLVAG
jgi:competence protein ComEC